MWDKLSPKDRHELIKTSLVPGRVIHFFCDFTSPPKEKFLVLVAQGPEPLFFIINSQINQFIKNKPHLFQCQVKMDSARHSTFLTHDSYLDCTHAHAISVDDLLRQIDQNPGRIKDAVHESVIDQILAAVKLSKTLSKQQKEIIIKTLGRPS